MRQMNLLDKERFLALANCSLRKFPMNKPCQDGMKRYSVTNPGTSGRNGMKRISLDMCPLETRGAHDQSNNSSDRPLSDRTTRGETIDSAIKDAAQVARMMRRKKPSNISYATASFGQCKALDFTV